MIYLVLLFKEIIYNTMANFWDIRNNVEVLTKSETITLIQEWSDLSFEYNFTNVSSVNVNHNLNKYPIVVLKDTSWRQSFVSVVHTDKNNLTASWQWNTTWTIICS